MASAYIFAGCSSHAAAVTLRELQSPAVVSPPVTSRPTKPVAPVTKIKGFFITVGSFEVVRAIFESVLI